MRKAQLDFRCSCLGAEWVLQLSGHSIPLPAWGAAMLPRPTHAAAASGNAHTCLLCRSCPTTRTAPQRTLRSLQRPARRCHIIGPSPSGSMAA